MVEALGAALRLLVSGAVDRIALHVGLVRCLERRADRLTQPRVFLAVPSSRSLLPPSIRPVVLPAAKLHPHVAAEEERIAALARYASSSSPTAVRDRTTSRRYLEVNC